MKRIFALLLATAMVISMTACAGKADEEPAVGGPCKDPQQDSVNLENEKESERMNIMDNIEIVEKCPDEAAARRDDVTYETPAHHSYSSETTGRNRGVNVLLPAGYDASKKYPVLYLLHGIFGDENSMTDPSNKVPEIVANLFADGVSKEMIVVYPNMYASSDPAQQPGFDNASIAPYDNFINDLVNDLMPYIEENYSVLTGRENTAIAGFSMGGRETLFIGLQRPDLFGYVGAISPAPGLTPGKDWAMEHPGQLSEDELTFDGKDYSPYLLMVCCGTNDGVVGTFPKSYHEIFDKNGTKHVWYEIQGADHDATAIKSGLYNFISNIFVD